MKRIFIDDTKDQIILCENGLLNVKLHSGKTFTGLEARRLFPLTRANEYISLLNESGGEQAVIRNVNDLSSDSKKAVMGALDQYYFIPKIIRITHINEKFGTIRIDALTDHGTCYFEIRNRAQNMKVLSGGRVLLRDTNDNRYEIPDFKNLDRRSLDAFLL